MIVLNSVSFLIDFVLDIGQEAKTKEFDDEIKLTPFNMREEMEEGDFDKDGYYHWKKDVISSFSSRFFLIESHIFGFID